MSESLLPKKQSNQPFCTKKVYSGLAIAALTGVIALYLTVGNDSTNESSPHGHSVNNLRVLGANSEVKEFPSLKKSWRHFNLVNAEIRKISASYMEGTLVEEEIQSTFEVSYVDKYLLFVGKSRSTQETLETFYSKQTEEAPVYQFTDKKGNKVEGMEAFKALMNSDLLSSMYLLSLKLAQYGFTGQLAPVIKGYHSVTQTLAKKEATEKEVKDRKFTKEMQEVLQEINENLLQENKNKKTQSLLKTTSSLFNDKLWIGPCSRFRDCHCELNSTCDNPCYGECGVDCNCWAFVCGDCNCHCFCQHHDYYCSCSFGDPMCWSIWLWFDACC